MAGNLTLPTENIDEVILGLLALEPNEVEELDYQTYKQYLKELLIEITKGKKISGFETDLLKNEFKRIKSKKGRFKLKSKKISANSFATKSIAKKVKGTQQRLLLMPSGGIKENAEVLSDKKNTNPLLNIANTLSSILETLISIHKNNIKDSEKSRRDDENKKRRGKESELESKTFDGIKKIASTILKPFESIWQRILKFITMVLLGRAFIKLIGWIGDPKNQEKIQSVIRFFSDHWPTLLALYLRFGTGIGRFVGKLGGILVKGAFKLGALATRLALKAGIGKAGGKLSKVAGFLGGPRGKLLAAGIGIAADVAVTAGAAGAIDKFTGTQQFSGGGAVKVPRFAGGGFANFGKIFGGAGLGSMFGPLGMMLGAGIGGLSSGLVSGPKGRDKVPAMLTDGEFVMSVGAVNKYGVETLEAMNAAGGGTNQPKVVGGKTYAFGGGRVGDIGDSRSSINNIKDFIKYKIGFDVDKPETWGKSFASGISGMFGGSKSGSNGYSSPGSGTNLNEIRRQFEQGGANLYNQTRDNLGQGAKLLANRVLNYGNDKKKQASNILSDIKGFRFNNETYSQLLKSLPLGLKTRVEDGVVKTSGGTKQGQLEQERRDSRVIQKLRNTRGPLTKVSNYVADAMDKGIIPVPTSLPGGAFGEYGYAGLTFLKSIAGPLGRPFRILENDAQKAFLQQSVNRTSQNNAFNVDKKGNLVAGWNRIGQTKDPQGRYKLNEGSGAYSDEGFGNIKGQYANAIHGRFNMRANQRGEVYIDDASNRYDWNEGVVNYVKKVTGGQLDLTNTMSVVGNFLDDIGWLNSRPLGTNIKVGNLPSNISRKTGKKKTRQELELEKKLSAERKKAIENRKKLEENRPWWDKMGLFGGTSAQIKKNQESRKNFSKNNPAAKLYNKPQKNTGQPYKSRFALPRNDKVNPVKPPPKPKSSSSSTYRGGQRSSRSSSSINSQKPRTQNPTHSSRSTRTARSTLGINK